MGIRLGSDGEAGSTAVPNVFIDEYMTSANGEFVKIYLYLLRCMGSREETVSISRMADRMSHTDKDVERALKYWEKVGLLRLELDGEDRLTGIYLVEEAGRQRSAERKKRDKVSLRRAEPEKDRTRPYYTGDELERFGEQEDVQEFICFTESLLGKLLNSTELQTMMFWYNGLSMSAELIEYLVEYCAENRHKSFSYMDKVALSWAEKGIDTVEKAREETRIRSRLYNKVVKAFGISDRNLAQPELAFLDCWKKEWGFSEELILEACNRTILAINKPSFEYANTILSSWRKQGVKTMEDVAKVDELHSERLKQQRRIPAKKADAPAKFNEFPQRTYNYDELEKQFEEILMIRQSKG